MEVVVATDPRDVSFREFFKLATNGFSPYGWQLQVALDGLPDVLPVPTGLGKTEVALAWAWRLLVDQKPEPRHLVVCLPMRSLVTQTVQRLKTYFDALKAKKPQIDVAVHQLMGGAVDDEWVGQPDKPWVLVGTQDQLLSRTLNRGYAMSRFEWPVHFGLLNNDCRWLIDEVQLMGPGLWTTSQLDWMRRKRFGTLFDCPTTWMSATVSMAFLDTVDRKKDGLENGSWLPSTVIDNDPNREVKRRLEARKSINWWPGTANPTTKTKESEVDFWMALAQEVSTKHVRGTLSLVICNTVEAAQRIYEALPGDDVPKALLTSRFRRQDREEHEKKLLDFEGRRKAVEAEHERRGRENEMGKPLPDDHGLICVSTQVVEAGVDVSAHHLWSEVAPWPSLLQRLGRLNRDGLDQKAEAWFWEASAEEPRKRKKKGGPERAGPYDLEEIELAKQLIRSLIKGKAGRPFLQMVEDLRATHRAELNAALRPKPEPMPRALDVHGL